MGAITNHTRECIERGAPISVLALTMAMLPSIIFLGVFIVCKIRLQVSPAAGGAERLVAEYDITGSNCGTDADIDSENDTVFLSPAVSQKSHEGAAG